MKRLLTSLAVVAIVASTSVIQTNTVHNKKLLALDPPVILFPPNHLTGRSITSVLNVAVSVPTSTTKTV